MFALAASIGAESVSLQTVALRYFGATCGVFWNTTPAKRLTFNTVISAR
jgi:hypothetical protein